MSRGVKEKRLTEERGNLAEVEDEVDFLELLKSYDSDDYIKAAKIVQDKPKLFVELLKALDDDDHYIRIGSACSLGLVGDQRAIDPLIQVLKSDQNEDVRMNAAESLGRIGDSRAIDPLKMSLKSDKSKYVRANAVEALEKIGGAKVVDAIIQALRDDASIVRLNSARSLMSIDDDRAIPALQNLVETEMNDGVRGWVSLTLRSLQFRNLKKSAETTTEDLEKLKEEAELSEPLLEKINEITKPFIENVQKIVEEQEQELQDFKDTVKTMKEKSPGLVHGLPYFEKYIASEMKRLDEKLKDHMETHKHQESIFWAKLAIIVMVISIIISVLITLISSYVGFNP